MGKSAYNIFMQLVKPKLVEDNPGLAYSELSMKLTQIWNDLKPDGRKIYEDLAAKKKADERKDMLLCSSTQAILSNAAPQKFQSDEESCKPAVPRSPVKQKNEATEKELKVDIPRPCIDKTAQLSLKNECIFTHYQRTELDAIQTQTDLVFPPERQEKHKTIETQTDFAFPTVPQEKNKTIEEETKETSETKTKHANSSSSNKKHKNRKTETPKNDPNFPFFICPMLMMNPFNMSQMMLQPEALQAMMQQYVPIHQKKKRKRCSHSSYDYSDFDSDSD